MTTRTDISCCSALSVQRLATCFANPRCKNSRKTERRHPPRDSENRQWEQTGRYRSPAHIRDTYILAGISMPPYRLLIKAFDSDVLPRTAYPLIVRVAVVTFISFANEYLYHRRPAAALLSTANECEDYGRCSAILQFCRFAENRSSAQ